MDKKRYQDKEKLYNFSEEEYQKMIKEILKGIDTKKFIKNFTKVLDKYEMLAPLEDIKKVFFNKLSLEYTLYRGRIYTDIIEKLIPEEIRINLNKR